MPRKPRLEFPGAIYHIHHRGNHQEYICQDDDDRKLFLKLLESTIQRMNWICHAYCLMGNHYHLLIEIPDSHPALISRDVFQSVQTLLHQRRPQTTPSGRSTSPYLLSGLIRCPRCDSRMNIRSAKSGRYHYYECQLWAKSGSETCLGTRIPKQTMDDLILNTALPELLSETHIRSLTEHLTKSRQKEQGRLQTRLRTVDRELERSGRRLENLYDAVERGKMKMEDLQPRIEGLRSRIQELENEKGNISERLTSEGQHIHEGSEAVKAAQELMVRLPEGTDRERRRLLQSFIERIDVNRPEVEISYKLPYQNKKSENHLPDGSHSGLAWLPERDAQQNFLKHSFRFWKVPLRKGHPRGECIFYTLIQNPQDSEGVIRIQ